MSEYTGLAFALLASTAMLASFATAQNQPQPKMGAPLRGLAATERTRFDAGSIDFRHVFAAPEGLGPIFNQNACSSCHNNPIGGSGSITVVRFGFYDPKGIGFDPLSSLGGSLLQAQAINVACSEVVPGAANVQAQRVTPSALGLGLIEAIPDAAIASRETNPPSPAVSGRAHMVTPLETPQGPLRVGRFGWKAQVATVLTFSGDALLNEMGITNRLVPAENAPNGNVPLLLQYDTVPDPEDGPNGQGLHFIDRITDFQRYLAAPPQTPRSGMTGEQIFASVGCTHCHVASFSTRNDPSLEPALRNQVIRPYSDFLLHDMGPAADFIAQGQATVQELRTPSLWGMRARDPLWHDGRIAGGTLAQRILGPTGVIFQHAAFGSESETSAIAFAALSPADKDKVVLFLDSLGRAEFDANGDNVLDRRDLAAFLAARGGGPYSPDAPQAVFDFDQNGTVDNVDFQTFVLVYEEDCNGNNQNDLLDVLYGSSIDANGNHVPDECEHCQTSLGFAGGGTLAISLCGDDLTTAGSAASFWLRGAMVGAPAFLAISPLAIPVQVLANEWLVPSWPPTVFAWGFVADSFGEVRLPVYGWGGGGAGPSVATWIVQAGALDLISFDLSNALSVQLGY